MNTFFKDSWNEYLQLLETHLPSSIVNKFKANSARYLKIIAAVIALEVLVAFVWYANEPIEHTETNTTIITKD